MKYLDKSFSVSMSNVSQERWDEVFGKKGQSATPAPEQGIPTVSIGGDLPVPPAAEAAPEDYSNRQCVACLEKGTLAPMQVDGELVPGLLQCGACAAREPLGVEVAAKFHGDAACVACGGTGRLRSTFAVFGCGTCGGTGAK